MTTDNREFDTISKFKKSNAKSIGTQKPSSHRFGLADRAKTCDIDLNMKWVLGALVCCIAVSIVTISHLFVSIWS